MRLELMSVYAVGLTGGIACGKSLLAQLFEALNTTVVDADTIARQVVEPGPVLNCIVARFGSKILRADGCLDRRFLRQRVFADVAERKALEAIVHPVIRARLKQAAVAAAGPYVLVVIPLLAEAGGRIGYPWLQRILVVDAIPEVQHARLMQRDSIDAEQASLMIAAQIGRKERLAIADDIVFNDGDPAHLGGQVCNLDARYRALASVFSDVD
ncbi:dephospho-CoA kinase [Xylella fastidiosa MUL0034]|nr:dephospho-CoA kinase [Xylella fastidiosa MUL0034]